MRMRVYVYVHVHVLPMTTRNYCDLRVFLRFQHPKRLHLLDNFW